MPYRQMPCARLVEAQDATQQPVVVTEAHMEVIILEPL